MRNQNPGFVGLHRVDLSDTGKDSKNERGKKGGFAGMKNTGRNMGFIIVTITICTTMFFASVFVSRAASGNAAGVTSGQGKCCENPDAGYCVIVEETAGTEVAVVTASK